METKQHREWPTADREVDLNQWRDRFNWVEDIQVSPDGEHVAAIVNVDEAQFTLCLDGEPLDLALEKAWSLRFLPDNRPVFIGCEEDEWTVYIDGRPWETRFDYAWGLQWSAGGVYVAVAIQKDMEYGMAVNDTAWDTLYENMTCPVLSEKGTTAAVVQTEPLGQGDITTFSRGIFSAALNGNVLDSRHMNVWDLSFDPSGTQLAYVIRKNRTDYGLVRNDTAWKSNFQAAWQPVFVNQGTCVLAPVRKGGKWFLFREDTPFWPLPFEQLWQVTLSPGEDRIAAIVSKNWGQWTVCEDLKTWDMAVDGMIRDLSHTPDGRHLLALCRHKGSWDLAVDGRLWGLHADRVWKAAAGGKSGIIALRMIRDGKYRYGVNGKIYPGVFDLAFDPVIHPDEDLVMLRTVTNGIYRKQVLSLDALLKGVLS